MSKATALPPSERTGEDNRSTGSATGMTKCKVRGGQGNGDGWWAMRSSAARVASEVASAKGSRRDSPLRLGKDENKRRGWAAGDEVVGKVAGG